MSDYVVVRSSDYLEHHGILGMKWGVRRFQNPDGSLTEEGRKRYGDILTKDQMKGMVRSYNLRTGSNKKINKNTTFKTADGKVYDHKGRRLDTETSVEDPKNETERKEKERKEAEKKQKEEANRKTDSDKSKKDISKMSDQELRDLNARMQQEIDFKEKYSKLHPEKVTIGKQFTTNLKNSLAKDVPAAFSEALRNYIKDSLRLREDDKKPEHHTNIDIDTNTASDEEISAAVKRARDIKNYQSVMGDLKDTKVSDIPKGAYMVQGAYAEGDSEYFTSSDWSDWMKVKI